MAYSWEGKIVLITGAATGIGAAVVRAVLEENVKHVAVLDIDESAGKTFENEINSKYGESKFKFYQCDVTNEKVLLSIFDAVKEEHGYIDVVINNAGIMNDRMEVYKKAIDVNVTAVCTGTLKAIEIMRKDRGGKGGAVINVSSIAGLHQSPSLPIYFATKSAVLMFSNCIGMEEYYSKSEVRVLTVCFGATDTALLTEQKLGSFDEDQESNLLAMLTNYPYQTPEAAAQGVVSTFKKGSSGSTWLITSGRPAEDITNNINKAYEIMSTGIFV